VHRKRNVDIRRQHIAKDYVEKYKKLCKKIFSDKERDWEIIYLANQGVGAIGLLCSGAQRAACET